MLCEKDRRNYNIQKVKWEAEQRRIDRLPISPKDKKFSEEEAAKMVAGQYWDVFDDEDDHI